MPIPKQTPRGSGRSEQPRKSSSSARRSGERRTPPPPAQRRGGGERRTPRPPRGEGRAPARTEATSVGRTKGVQNPYDDEEVFSQDIETERPPRRKRAARPAESSPRRRRQPEPVVEDTFEDDFHDEFEDMEEIDDYNGDFDDYDDEAHFDSIEEEDFEEDVEPEPEPEPRPTRKKRQPRRRTGARRGAPIADKVDNGDDDEEPFEGEAYGFADNHLSDDMGEEEIEIIRRQKMAYDFYDTDEPQEEVEKEGRRRKAKRKRLRKKRGEEKPDSFVDEKNLKLRPFGDKPGTSEKNRKLRVSEFDKRANKAKNAKIVSTVIIVLIIALIALGVKNALVPPKVHSDEEIASIALKANGDTGFPTEKGRAFAEDFIKAYLSVGTTSRSAQALNFFYQGKINDTDFSGDGSGTPSGDSTGVFADGTYNAELLTQPRVYESTSISSNSAYFTVGALVAPGVALDDKERLAISAGGAEAPVFDNATPRWVFFQVNVYYDTEKSQFFIDPSSPTLVPGEDVGNAGDIPDMAKIGTGEEVDDTTFAEITPVVLGYTEAYGKASSDNTAPVDAYLSSDAKPTAKNGLNNSVTLSGEPSNAVKLVAYTTEDPNVVKARVTVSWQISLNRKGQTDTAASVRYRSNYVATLSKAGGQWKIQNFDGLKYVPEEGGD